MMLPAPSQIEPGLSPLKSEIHHGSREFVRGNDLDDLSAIVDYYAPLIRGRQFDGLGQGVFGILEEPHLRGGNFFDGPSLAHVFNPNRAHGAVDVLSGNPSFVV